MKQKPNVEDYISFAVLGDKYKHYFITIFFNSIIYIISRKTYFKAVFIL